MNKKLAFGNIGDTQEELIRYCCQRESRSQFLVQAQEAGLLDQSYPHSTKLFTEDLYEFINNIDACEEGRTRALNHFFVPDEELETHLLENGQISELLRRGVTVYIKIRDAKLKISPDYAKGDKISLVDPHLYELSIEDRMGSILYSYLPAWMRIEVLVPKGTPIPDPD